jgi:predicted nucleotidyltransferase
MNELNEIRQILSKYIDLSKNEVFLFGSRAKGTHRNNSDLDILIMDNNVIPPASIAKLSEEFEESNIPFKIDIVIRSRIDNNFYNKIKPDLIRI